MDDPADQERLRASAERDQLWASLRALLPEIDQLAAGQFDSSERERQLVQVLARIVAAELDFQSDRGDADQSEEEEGV